MNPGERAFYIVGLLVVASPLGWFTRNAWRSGEVAFGVLVWRRNSDALFFYLQIAARVCVVLWCVGTAAALAWGYISN